MSHTEPAGNYNSDLIYTVIISNYSTHRTDRELQLYQEYIPYRYDYTTHRTSRELQPAFLRTCNPSDYATHKTDVELQLLAVQSLLRKIIQHTEPAGNYSNCGRIYRDYTTHRTGRELQRSNRCFPWSPYYTIHRTDGELQHPT